MPGNLSILPRSSWMERVDALKTNEMLEIRIHFFVKWAQ